MTKSNLRKLFLEKRKNLHAGRRREMSQAIFKKLISLSFFNDAKNVHLFLHSEKLNEVNTFFILDYLFSQNKNVVIPKVSNNTIFSYSFHKDTPLAPGSFGILEPTDGSLFNEEDLDLVIVPLLICDTKGNRIGYGGGFYDLLLSRTPKAIKVGINFFLPTKQPFDVSETDIPLDYLVCPNKFFKF